MSNIRIEKKSQSNSRTSLCHIGFLHLATVLILTCLAGGVSNAATSKLYPPSKDQAGALRLSQIMQLATREEILKLTSSRQLLLASGLKDSDFKDGSLAMGRVYCCHQSTEEGTAVWFYVPHDVPVKPGDIVAIRMGHESTKNNPGVVNMAVEVREKEGAPDAKCSWDPPNDRLWRRMLYCTWMPAEGWTRTKGAWATWLRRDSDAKIQ
jgi:hypothetical protein